MTNCYNFYIKIITKLTASIIFSCLRIIVISIRICTANKTTTTIILTCIRIIINCSRISTTSNITTRSIIISCSWHIINSIRVCTSSNIITTIYSYNLFLDAYIFKCINLWCNYYSIITSSKSSN